MKLRDLLLIFFLLPLMVVSQDSGSFGIRFAGFVKNDFTFDTRQTVAARQGHFLLYPKGKQLDTDGNDINARHNLHLLAIQSRLQGFISAPDVLGAKTSGYIEGEFFGNVEPNINTFRLRHAFVKLAWPRTELMFGQFWHAMFITDCYAGTVSFNTGAPFQPFSRNPQIRLTQSVGKLKVIATAMSQIDFTSTGPAGASSDYIRNAAMPELNLTLQYQTENKSKGTAFLAGIGGDYKSLLPRLVTDSNYKTDVTVTALSTMAFLKIQLPAITMKFEGVYGQDCHHLTMLGGYAVEDKTDPARDIRKYTPVNTFSFWGDIFTKVKLWEFGVFGGYTKNLGSDNIIGLVEVPGNNGPVFKQVYYSRGSNIDYIYRFSPRIVYSPGKIRFAFEVEYTAAAYGTPDDHGIVQNSEAVGNLRFLLGAYIFF